MQAFVPRSLVIPRGFIYENEATLYGRGSDPLDLSKNETFAAIFQTDDFYSTILVSFVMSPLEQSTTLTRVKFALTNGATGSLARGDAYWMLWVVGDATEYQPRIQYRGKVEIR